MGYELLCLKILLKELGYDFKAAISITHSPVQHVHTK